MRKRSQDSGIEDHPYYSAEGFDSFQEERERFRKRRRRDNLIIGVVATAGVGLMGTLFYFDQQAPDTGMNPNDRFKHDYINHESSCFMDEAYDLTAGNQGRNSFTPPSSSYDAESDILTITPPSGSGILHVMGFKQNEHSVSQVDESDRAIFSSYGCEVKTY